MAMVDITVINPTITREWDEADIQTYARVANPDTRIRVVSLDWGTASIERRVDDVLAAPGVLQRAIEAERSGASAVIINCMNDPGLYAAREVVRIPVVGPAEACMHLAAMLTHRSCLITTSAGDIPVVEELILRYHMSSRLTPVRAIGVPVLQLETDRQAALLATVNTAELAVREDGAGAIILGCTMMAEMAEEIQAGLSQRGIEVPLLNPPLVALRLAESMIALKLSHSQRTFASPGEKAVKWFAPVNVG